MRTILAVFASAMLAGCQPTTGPQTEVVETPPTQSDTREDSAPTTDVPGAPPGSPSCNDVNLSATSSAVVAARLCPTSGAVPGVASGDSLSNYYGYVTATATYDVTDSDARRSLGNFLATIFRTQEFTAELSLALEIQTSSGVTVLPERPLLLVQRTIDGQTTVRSDFTSLYNTQISPFFALDAGNSTVQARFRFRRVNNVRFRLDEIAASASEVLASQGVEGWLITGLSEPAIMNALTESQKHVSRYFSDEVSMSASAPLTFTSGSQSGLTFTTGWRGDLSTTITIALQLRARQSLITETLTTGTPPRPRVLDATPGTWAQRIVVVPAQGTAPARSLGAVISESGVPRRLGDLQSGPSTTSDPEQLVENACRDLARALADNQYFRLNQIDSDLILFDELRSAGVFSRFAPSRIQCVRDRLQTWDSYGLRPAPSDPVQFAAMENRFNRLRVRWSAGTIEERRSIRDAFTSTVALRVHRSLFPGLVDYLAENDIALEGRLNGAPLAEAQITCLGDYRRLNPNVGLAFARFARSPDDVYAIRAEFVQDEVQGVLISSFQVLPATPAELAERPQASCVAAAG